MNIEQQSPGGFAYLYLFSNVHLERKRKFRLSKEEEKHRSSTRKTKVGEIQNSVSYIRKLLRVNINKEVIFDSVKKLNHTHNSLRNS